MSTIHDLLDKIQDESLRERLAQEIEHLTKQKKFGLVYEQHMPECTPLYGIEVKRGSTVAKKNGKVTDNYMVTGIVGGNAICKALFGDNAEETIAIKDLVIVSLFGEPIYPTLQLVDSTMNAPESKLWHMLIEADNFHALQLLEYLYPQQVDCIYIDPPYNTGAKDWKYNNDYVDASDSYRHSKWLSMMEKRLRIAKRLLNPKDSVLIITIDEKEYLHLGCLLEELFPDARIQMVTTVISAKGVVRVGQFSRVEEYIFIIELGKSSILANNYNMLDNEIKKVADRDIEWLGFRRRAPQAKRESRPNQFYPIFVNNESGHIRSIGDVVLAGINRNTIPVPDGCTALWPLSKNGDERLWSLIPEQARANFERGYLRINNWNKKMHKGTVYYLPSGTIDDIENGNAKTLGYNDDGSIKAKYIIEGTTPPKRVWNMKTHNSETYGTNLLNAFIGNRFDYPKSLYAVHDTIRFFVANKPNALIVDFFAGSGTTLHAVNLLNAEDGGNRRCIMVTNNEVSEEERKRLTAEGFQPGDKEWEDLGIARYVTWPRTKCSILGKDVNGNPIKGEYLGTDSSMADGFKANANFFKLSFLDKNAVALGTQFKEIIPILWMKSGAVGKLPALEGEVPSMMVLEENEFAVLTDEFAFYDFAKQLKSSKGKIMAAYIVTDSSKGFEEMSSELVGIKCYQLYRDYLDNFRINCQKR